MKKLTVFLLMMLLTLPVVAKQGNGKGAGGARTEHASEMGMEKGKAWAGSKEKKEKEEKEKEEKKEKKSKKNK